mgnify:FL=1
MQALFAIFWFALGALIGGIGMMWLLLWPDARRERELIEELDAWDAEDRAGEQEAAAQQGVDAPRSPRPARRTPPPRERELIEELDAWDAKGRAGEKDFRA